MSDELPGPAVDGAQRQDGVRLAARVLPVNVRGEVLLLHGWDPVEPDRPYWFSVGGGLDEGESFLDAAVRELREEVGIVVSASEMAGPFADEQFTFSFGGREVTQRQLWFTVQVGEIEPTLEGLDELERGTIGAAAWWAPDELDNLVLARGELRQRVQDALALCRVAS